MTNRKRQDRCVTFFTVRWGTLNVTGLHVLNPTERNRVYHWNSHGLI